MSNFKKYQHVERFGTTSVAGIEDGECYVFPKIDGTNASVWLENGVVQAGSRNRHLTIDEDNAGFCKWVSEQEVFVKFFEMFPTVRLYGEWLVPHTLKTYNDKAWRNFYVFDAVEKDSELHLHYEDYKKKLDMFNIEYIPPICKVNNPTLEGLTSLLDKNVYLIKDNSGVGEGIVIKRYDYINRFGRQVWAKVVNNEFKFKHKKIMKVGEINERKMVEQEIVDRYITKSLCEKEYAKITIDCEWESKMIPQLINTVFFSLVSEESWNFVKRFKKPTINYKTLSQLTSRKIKEHLSHLF